jgi:hypothetical protein
MGGFDYDDDDMTITFWMWENFELGTAFVI